MKRRAPELLGFSVGGRRLALIIEADPQASRQKLTPAERAVANLLQRGLSNRQIADARGTSIRTVANQVASLLRKLNVGSRVELARKWSY